MSTLQAYYCLGKLVPRTKAALWLGYVCNLYRLFLLQTCYLLSADIIFQVSICYILYNGFYFLLKKYDFILVILINSSQNYNTVVHTNQQANAVSVHCFYKKKIL